MGGASAETVLAKPRRSLPWLLLLAVLAASPSTREALLAFFRSLLASFRISRFLRPSVRKDFLGAAKVSASGAARQVAPKWSSPQAGKASTASTRSEVPWGEPGTEGAFGDYAEVLPPFLAEGLRRGGFHSLKPIQRKVLPLALTGRDVCGVAPTGSGKTLAFLVPGLVHINGQPPLKCAADGPIALVLAPTRELAIQIGKVAEGLMKPSFENESGWGQRTQGLSSAVLYGGARRSDQLQTLRFQNCTHLIVATPGRLLDFLEHGAFTLQRVSFFVLDEGDRMLDFGFEPDVTSIAKQIRSDRQMLFFSATWPMEVKQAALRLCQGGQDFEMVSAKPVEDDDDLGTGNNDGLQGHGGLALPPREIQQVVEVIDGGSSNFYNVRGDMETKVPLLLSHLEEALGGSGPVPGKALIFVGTRVAAEDLGNMVARHFGLDRCGVMHGARKQDQREATLQAFRTGRIKALVATDVLGRGVDIPDVTHVVIYDFPGDIETYIHRVGRTGRNGQQGKSIAFYEQKHWYPDLARELVNVLKACNQEVPQALAREAGAYDEVLESSGGAGGVGCWNTPKPEDSQLWTIEDGQSWRKVPPLESDSPDLATEKELGVWHAAGVRVWGYSANGGRTEQGRLELRSGGKLRTTWGWGEWALLPSAPHCPPPSRRCPTPVGQQPAEGEADIGAGKSAKEPPAPVAKEPPAKPAAQHLSLTWGGCTDVIALDCDGNGFELVSRSGRPASTYKNKTLGRALPGMTL